MAEQYGDLQMSTSGRTDANAYRRVSDLTLSKSLEPEDSLSEKLFRETQVFIGGAALGFGQTAADRLINHFPETAMQSAAFAGLTYGIVRFASANTPLKYAIPVLSTAMTYSFLGNSIKTLPDQVRTISGAWKQTWSTTNSDTVFAEQKKVANTVGPFLFDTTVGMMSGMIGGKIAANQIENKNLLGFMKDKYQERLDHSIFRIASEPDATGLRNIGSSFAIEPNKLATAFHVVQDQPGQTWTFLNKTERGSATIVAGFPQSDLAILSIKEGPKLNAIPVAKQFIDGEPGILVGIPANKFVQSPAYFRDGVGVTANSFKADLGYENGGGFIRVVRGGKAWPGMSGGPAISTNGEVVGVVASTNPVLSLFGVGSNSIPGKNLTYFEQLLERSKSNGSLSLAEASHEFGFSGAKILDQIRKGKIDAFVVPSSTNIESWEWRILKK